VSLLDLVAQAFLLAYRPQVCIATTGVTKDVFCAVYDKYCGAGTPIDRYALTSPISGN
jgi:hypothetical protein